MKSLRAFKSGNCLGEVVRIDTYHGLVSILSEKGKLSTEHQDEVSVVRDEDCVPVDPGAVEYLKGEVEKAFAVARRRQPKSDLDLPDPELDRRTRFAEGMLEALKVLGLA